MNDFALLHIEHLYRRREWIVSLRAASRREQHEAANDKCG